MSVKLSGGKTQLKSKVTKSTQSRTQDLMWQAGWNGRPHLFKTLKLTIDKTLLAKALFLIT